MRIGNFHIGQLDQRAEIDAAVNAALEERADDYTAALVAQIVERSEGEQATYRAEATGALESAAGLWGRSFATAEIETPSEGVRAALTPDLLMLIGRALIRRGELVLLIDVDANGLRLSPVATHNVTGSHGEWMYDVTVAGPSSTVTRSIAADGVVHLRYAVSESTPWRGLSPLQVATLAGKLSANLAGQLVDEASGPRGNVLPIPIDGEDPSVAKLRADIRRLGGKVALVEGGDWDVAGKGRATDWMPRRLGAAPPPSVIDLLRAAREDILGACGVHPALVSQTQGTTAREAYRQFLHSSVAPIGKVVSHELTAKLDVDVRLEWSELRAGDIAGRARAFASLVKSGMELDKAAALTGLLVDD